MYDPTSQCNEINHIDCSFEHCDIAEIQHLEKVRAECEHPNEMQVTKTTVKVRCVGCGVDLKHHTTSTVESSEINISAS